MPLGYVAVPLVAERLGDVRTAVTATAVTLAVGLPVAGSREVRGLQRLPAATVPPVAPPVYSSSPA